MTAMVMYKSWASCIAIHNPIIIIIIIIIITIIIASDTTKPLISRCNSSASTRSPWR